MIAQIQKSYYSPEQYLELEETAEYKSEYIDGEIIPMTRGTTNHNKIALNFCANFKFNMKGKNYEIYINDVRLWISKYRRYTYPDIMIIEGQPIYEAKSNATVTNPILIIEVLSESTKNYDQGEKFKAYRSLESLQEYILIDQYNFSVEQCVRQSFQEWKFTEYQGKNEILKLEKINFQLPFSDIYEGITFNKESEN